MMKLKLNALQGYKAEREMPGHPPAVQVFSSEISDTEEQR